jgi:hypothetical protein
VQYVSGVILGFEPMTSGVLTIPTCDVYPCYNDRSPAECPRYVPEKYGFACNPDLFNHPKLMHTLQACLHDHISINSAPRNRKVDTLCRDLTSLPPDVLHALGLRLGFCLLLNHKDKTPHQLGLLPQGHINPLHVLESPTNINPLHILESPTTKATIP